MSKSVSQRRALKRISEKQRAQAAQTKASTQKSGHLESIKNAIVSIKTNGYSSPQRKIGGREKSSNEHSKNERALTKATQRLRDFTAALVFVGILGVATSALQWWEIHSGSSDTHDLAAAAKNQSGYAQATAKTARDAYVAENRAFIGPTEASLNALVIGSGIKKIIQWKNTGREPVKVGQDFITRNYDDSTQWNVFGASITDIEMSKDFCMRRDIAPTSFAFPNSGFSQYTASMDTNAAGMTNPFVVTKDHISGKTVVTITGCMTYHSLSEIHHTAFCYYYRAGVTPDVSHLNLCGSGWDAD